MKMLRTVMKTLSNYTLLRSKAFIIFGLQHQLDDVIFMTSSVKNPTTQVVLKWEMSFAFPCVRATLFRFARPPARPHDRTTGCLAKRCFCDGYVFSVWRTSTFWKSLGKTSEKLFSKRRYCTRGNSLGSRKRKSQQINNDFLVLAGTTPGLPTDHSRSQSPRYPGGSDELAARRFEVSGHRDVTTWKAREFAESSKMALANWC